MSSLKKKPGKNKQSINNKVDKSKETIKEVSNLNKKHIADVLNSTKKIVASIKQKLDQQEIEDTFVPIIETTVIPVIESTIADAVVITEEYVDAVVNSFGNQVEMNIDFNSEIVDSINETNNFYPRNMLEFLKENFEKSQQFTINNTKEIVEFYTKNSNLILNINQKLVESINTPLESLLDLQNESLNKYKYWASEILKKKNKKS